MPLADTAESWLASHYDDDLVAWRRHIHPRHPNSRNAQEFATTQFVADRLVDAGLSKALPGGTGLICDLGPDHMPYCAPIWTRCR